MTTLPASEPQPTVPVRGLNPWLVRIPILMILSAMLFAVTMTILFVMYQVSMAGRIFPGVSAYGVSLGGMTQPEAETALADAFTYDEDAVFTFRYEDRFWQLNASELGVSFNAAATAQAAITASSGENPSEHVAQQVAAWFNGVTVRPVVNYDENIAREQLTAIALEIGQPPQNATLTIDGLEVITTPAQPGITLNIESALATLGTQITNLEPGGEIPLTVIESEPELVDVESTAAYIRAAISSPVLLVTNGADGNLLGPWRISPEQIAAALSITETSADGTPSYEVSVNLSSFADSVAELAPGLIVPPRDGRFVFNDENGELEMLQPAVDGRTLNVAETINRIEEAVFTTDARTVQIAYDFERPQYHNDITAAELGITEMVSSSRTFYSGSTAARRQNIEVGASFYNGVIIAPGENFSFNEIVGEISEETGFVEGAIIFGGRTVKGIGGGVCQVSTTAYRAAFAGGYEIMERHSHGYRVGYYELGGSGPGLDAAIYITDPGDRNPGADFKFANNTDYHLLIETEFLPDIDAVEFRFYSTN
ncbi:MAG: VanW family protein, partial [Chloroflexota bacterium]